jgi:hypothetical protein
MALQLGQRTPRSDVERLTGCSLLRCSPLFRGRSSNLLGPLHVRGRCLEIVDTGSQKRTFARREPERAMVEATPRSARQGIMLPLPRGSVGPD